MWVSESDGVGEDGNYDGQIPGALRAAGTRGLGMPGEVCFRGQEPLPARRPAGHRERAGSQGWVSLWVKDGISEFALG